MFVNSFVSRDSLCLSRLVEGVEVREILLKSSGKHKILALFWVKMGGRESRGASENCHG